MPGWFTTQFAAGFLCGVLFGAVIYIADWIWNVKIQPKRDRKKMERGEYPLPRTIDAALREKERRETEASTPPLSASLLHPRPVPPLTDADETEESLRLDTTDFPATVEHPAPTTSLIDFGTPPPRLPYGGPERRLRSDNPYPELRRRADDRERQEDEDARRPPKPPAPAGATRMTRAEERRLREAGDTQGERTDTDGES